MSSARKLDRIPIQEYLAGEFVSPVKHEYLGGAVYAMAGGRVAHNSIATNTVASVHARLRGKSCRPFNSDMKIRIELPTQTRFYYPDASITCRPNPPADSFLDAPAVIFEVLSRRTRRVDEGEKKDAYLTIASLGVYVLIEQDAPIVVAFRRSKHGFDREVYEGLDAVLPLPEVEIELPLAEIYEAIDFTPEPEEDN